ncbi:MAG: hypothetical protein IPN06_09975 [Burkholderiales bacterium]|nr:hypothetical protein [Burkholderiales bacterium]
MTTATHSSIQTMREATAPQQFTPYPPLELVAPNLTAETRIPEPGAANLARVGDA